MNRSILWLWSWCKSPLKSRKLSRVMRWWLSRVSSRFGAKLSRERKPTWLSGLALSRLFIVSPFFSLWMRQNFHAKSSSFCFIVVLVCRVFYWLLVLRLISFHGSSWLIVIVPTKLPCELSVIYCILFVLWSIRGAGALRSASPDVQFPALLNWRACTVFKVYRS